MKKIVKHPKGLRLDGVVDNEGVGYIPTKEVGPMAVQLSGLFATADEKGNIDCKVIYPDAHNVEGKEEYNAHDKMDSKIQTRAKFVVGTCAAIIVACFIMLFVTISWPTAYIWMDVLMTIVYLAFVVLIIPKAFAIFVGRIFRNKEMIEFSKYLGAKNAVQNAYYDLGKTPNLEEVKDYSLHLTECKYTKMGYLASLWLLISVIRFIGGWWYWIAAIIAVILLLLLESENYLTFWQSLIVSKPDEKHYKVAIAAMEEAEELIDSIEISYHEIKGQPDPENFEEEKCKGCPAYDFCKEESQKLANESEKNADDNGDNNPADESGC